MIEKFTKDEFENVIEELCEKHNLHHYGAAYLDGEWCWSIYVDEWSFVHIRSSIGSDFYAKDTGEDSIRLHLCQWSAGTLGKDSARWVTRVAGWDTRLTASIERLIDLRKKSGNCPICDKPLHFFKVNKAGYNKGRLFAKCSNPEHKNKSWKWLS